MIKQTEKQFEQSGMSLEAAGLTREKLAEQNAEMAGKRVRGDFILKKIAEAGGNKSFRRRYGKRAEAHR